MKNESLFTKIAAVIFLFSAFYFFIYGIVTDDLVKSNNGLIKSAIFYLFYINVRIDRIQNTLDSHVTTLLNSLSTIIEKIKVHVVKDQE